MPIDTPGFLFLLFELLYLSADVAQCVWQLQRWILWRGGVAGRTHVFFVPDRIIIIWRALAVVLW